MVWVIFFLEFVILFITSRFLFKSIFALLYFLFHSQRVAIFFLSAFFLPGVFIHEISHLLVAELLQVKTHGIEFMPELSGTSLKMGSVKVEKSDIIRSLLIGIAPLVVGSSILTVSLFILSNAFSYEKIFASVITMIISFAVIVVIFIIANTMFSSKKDVEGLAEVLIVLVIIIAATYFTGFHLHTLIVPVMTTSKVVLIIGRIDTLLAIPVGINLVVVLLSLPLLKKLRIA